MGSHWLEIKVFYWLDIQISSFKLQAARLEAVLGTASNLWLEA